MRRGARSGRGRGRARRALRRSSGGTRARRRALAVRARMGTGPGRARRAGVSPVPGRMRPAGAGVPVARPGRDLDGGLRHRAARSGRRPGARVPARGLARRTRARHRAHAGTARRRHRGRRGRPRGFEDQEPSLSAHAGLGLLELSTGDAARALVHLERASRLARVTGLREPNVDPVGARPDRGAGAPRPTRGRKAQPRRVRPPRRAHPAPLGAGRGRALPRPAGRPRRRRRHVHPRAAAGAPGPVTVRARGAWSSAGASGCGATAAGSRRGDGSARRWRASRRSARRRGPSAPPPSCARAAHAPGAARGRAGTELTAQELRSRRLVERRADEQGGRRPPVPQPAHGRDPSRPRVPQARRAHPHRAGTRAYGVVVASVNVSVGL